VEHFLTNCTENGVDRNIKDASKKLQLDFNIKSVLNAVTLSNINKKIQQETSPQEGKIEQTVFTIENYWLTVNS
jgi:hypothetical protein